MATLVIKNLKTAVPADEAKVNLWNTGLEAACPCGTGDAQQAVLLNDLLPTCNTEEYAGTVEVPIYGNCNQYHRIPAEGELEVTCGTDAEMHFYLAMASETLSVEEKVAEEEGAAE